MATKLLKKRSFHFKALKMSADIIINFMVKLIIEKNDGGQRLDRFLKKYLKSKSTSSRA